MVREPPIGSTDVAPNDFTVHSVSQLAELPWEYIHAKTGVMPQECKPLECSVVLDGWSRFAAFELVLKLAHVVVCPLAKVNAREANKTRQKVFIVVPRCSFFVLITGEGNISCQDQSGYQEGIAANLRLQFRSAPLLDCNRLRVRELFATLYFVREDPSLD